MKSIIITLVCVLLAQFSQAQSLIVNKTVGAPVEILLKDIVSITFEDFGLTDSRDGKYYKTVKIGDQLWMAENLAFLPAVSPPSAGSNSNPYYYVYGYEGNSVSEAKNSPNYLKYGVLYNWQAATDACPAGWHLPTDAEWKILEATLGMSEADLNAIGNSRASGEVGKKLKSSIDWNGDNSSGFTALPSGNRHVIDLTFTSQGSNENYWTASSTDSDHAWRRALSSWHNNVDRANEVKGWGYSQRCIRN